MDVNYVILLIMAIIVGLAYGLPGVFNNWLKNGSRIEWEKLAATIIYSIFVGVVAVQTGVLNLDNISNWESILSPVWNLYMGLYLSMVYVFSKTVVPIAQQLSQKTQLYTPTVADPNRKMDAATRKWLISDQPNRIAERVEKAISDAEAEGLWRYAIEAGAWIYLVEFGYVGGTKHYYFRGWLGVQEVHYKKLSTACLEDIRKTGRIPEFNDLY